MMHNVIINMPSGINNLLLLFLLLLGHRLADYPIEGDFLTRGKANLTAQEIKKWPMELTIHSFIHGITVGLLTASTLLGVFEFVIHWIVDYIKFNGYFDVDTDQFIHVMCKVLWWGILVVGIL